ncbi:MAG: glycoside hydrolase family 127 protein [Treponema sp.]|jgi:hypothetical protein|nr:glycoside hydrolase family 127 protein [Treponema sp.]
MKNLRYRFFTANELKPSGWLREQLRIQAEGLCGNLDKVWPDVGKSKWIGGDREGWERLPYWLDGFIPMAWLLDDEDLKRRARFYIDAILDRQESDGWICPCTKEERHRYDVWVVFLICKVLVLYHDCTGDERIPGAVYRALKCLSLHLEPATLFAWGSARWFECIIPLRWLYERNPEQWMPDLALRLKTQGIDWKALFRAWPYKQNQGPGRWNFLTHVVNLAMCLKSEALYDSFAASSEEPLHNSDSAADDFAEEALRILLRDHGMPIGHFTGDECLAGRSPIHGTELCGIVEAMYSYEWLLALGAGDVWADRLETLAFNGLPAACSADMWTHQYDQMSNQVECSKLEKTHFLTNNEESHLFGLEPNFGCCTANFGQGWPKLALSGILRDGGGLAVGAIVPCTLDTVIQGVPVHCEIVSNYPFEDSYTVILDAENPVRFSLSLRFPASARNIRVNGEEIPVSTRRSINKTWQGKTELKVEMDFAAELVPFSIEEPHLVPSDLQGGELRITEEAALRNTLYFYRRGNLVFALPVKARWEKREYTRNGVERKFPYCDYEVYGESPWNFALSGGNGPAERKDLSLCREHFTGPAFTKDLSHAPLRLKVTCIPVDWPMLNGAASPAPAGLRPLGAGEEIELVPYGCTDLRMTLLPFINQ